VIWFIKGESTRCRGSVEWNYPKLVKHIK